MKRLVIGLVFILAGLASAQDGLNTSYWSEDYYGAGKYYSNSLLIGAVPADVDDYYSGEYYLNGQLAIIKVDSNWTASNIGIMVYNPLESGWEMLMDETGAVVEIVVAVGEPAIVPPVVSVGLKRIKFVKISSGVLVDQETKATRIAIETVRFN